tara:strand:- start:467 stop:769 length:303 start_codon:yes stop_codon:yes gene_type:complete
MIDNIPSSMQKLLTLGDIASAQKPVKDEDYFQLKRDHQNLLSSVTALLGLINDGEFSPLSGSGSPEGAVAANYSLLYVDTDTSQLYYNPVHGEATGWIAL